LDLLVPFSLLLFLFAIIFTLILLPIHDLVDLGLVLDSFPSELVLDFLSRSVREEDVIGDQVEVGTEDPKKLVELLSVLSVPFPGLELLGVRSRGDSLPWGGGVIWEIYFSDLRLNGWSENHGFLGLLHVSEETGDLLLVLDDRGWFGRVQRRDKAGDGIHLSWLLEGTKGWLAHLGIEDLLDGDVRRHQLLFGELLWLDSSSPSSSASF